MADCDQVKRLVILTPCVVGGLPTQGSLIAAGLRREGVPVAVIGRGQSARNRFADVAVRGLHEIAASDVVLVDIFAGRSFVPESIGIVYGRAFRRRVVGVLRGGWIPDFVRRWPASSRTILGLADVLVAPHRFLYEGVRALGIRVDRIIPNAIDLSQYRYRPPSPIRRRFLYLRGEHPIYNPELTLRAFARVQQQQPDTELTMAGKPYAGVQLADLARQLGLRNVTFLGLVPKEDIPRLAATHDIYVQSNRVENMPVTVLEMWASGVPVIATNVGGTPHLIRDRMDGLLVAEDEGRFAAACLDLLGDGVLAERLSRSGYERAQDYSWDRVAPQWVDVLGLAKCGSPLASHAAGSSTFEEPPKIV
ncbi:MAG: hypothetical protein QOD06_2763 [Candidatus Binatota bacterium]|jgi:glycosyltransferase involved in cell wall biosynthesis|nr:hypothetical protein [Candidatus Binatota bacterium]